MTSKIVAMIQARMASTRLPQKVTRLIGKEPMLQRVIQRAETILGVDRVVVVAPWGSLDDWISTYCEYLGVLCLRGSEQDVLGRYERAAEALGLESDARIVRITADCPALDPAVSRQVIALHETQRVDYASNLRDWPDGLDTEVFTRAALREAFHMATGDEDREHVTPWMRRNLFCLELPHEPNLRHLKWSVDTEEDLEYVREVYAGLGPNFSWGEILTLKPERVCQLCWEGAPHAQRSLTSIGGPRDCTVWDLHEIEVAGGAGIEECTAWAIHRRAAWIPRLTIAAPALDATVPRSPGGDPTCRSGAGDH